MQFKKPVLTKFLIAEADYNFLWVGTNQAVWIGRIQLVAGTS